MDRESQVLDKLKAIIDPDLGKDIVTLGFVKGLNIDDTGNVAFNLELKEMLEDYGLEEGANSDPKHYVVEKAFLD